MQSHIQQAIQQLNQVLLGKQQQIELAVACLIARGHLLIEDLPGMGKTTLAHALGNVFALDYRRVQFTSDMLPADILGVSVFDQHSQAFVLRKGPVFSQLLLADEINRATPKSQSALLEAMEERQVTLEGVTHPLPEPFFVIATQNPSTQSGTFPLPESQLDRFMMRISLGYPAPEVELELLAGGDRRQQRVPAVLSGAELQATFAQVSAIKTSPELIGYVQRLLSFTRQDAAFAAGLSPRAGLSLLQAARAWAFIRGRDYVLPDDVQQVLPSVVNHRVTLSSGGSVSSATEQMLAKVPVIDRS